MTLDVQDDDRWWSPKQAAEATGFTPQAMSQWGKTERVRRKEVTVGNRKLVRLLREDVLREAQISKKHFGERRPAQPTASVSALDSHELHDRLAMLEEVARRSRLIDELRDDIERKHLEIQAHRRQIEAMLLGPTRVPND